MMFLVIRRAVDYTTTMDTMKAETCDTFSSEPVDEQKSRFTIEAAMIAEADADIAHGRLIDEVDVDAWIDSIGTDHELPVPEPGR